MTIGIDASRAVKAVRTGTENYSWELIKRLIKLDQKNRFTLYAPHPPRETWPRSPRIEWRLIPQGRLWSQLRLARELRRHPPEVLFIPSHVVPLMSHLPTVVTVHDLAYKFFPLSYSPLNRRYLSFSTGVSVAKAVRVIAPSQATKNDLLEEYQLPPEKIVVIHHGYNREIFRADRPIEKPPLERPYILFVGRIEEKKNIRLLIEAFNLLAKEKKTAKLVLSGSRGYGFERITATIQSLAENIRRRIILPGYLPQYDMVRYLGHASVFAFPSLYEGFGLPVLEAMAVGTPVTASNTSALPEIAGEAAILLPPTNPLSWAAAFSRILNTPKLALELKARGLKRVEQFSWERTAAETLAVIVDAAKR